MEYIIVGIFMVSTGICHYFAKKKRLKAPFWVVLGALIGPVAIPFVLITKAKKSSLY